jgi:hypothetical protein
VYARSLKFTPLFITQPVYLSNKLKLEGASVSSPTVQNILIKNKMASRYDRLLKLESMSAGREITLSKEQIQAIEKYNPCC